MPRDGWEPCIRRRVAPPPPPSPGWSNRIPLVVMPSSAAFTSTAFRRACSEDSLPDPKIDPPVMAAILAFSPDRKPLCRLRYLTTRAAAASAGLGVARRIPSPFACAAAPCDAMRQVGVSVGWGGSGGEREGVAFAGERFFLADEKVRRTYMLLYHVHTYT